MKRFLNSMSDSSTNLADICPTETSYTRCGMIPRMIVRPMERKKIKSLSNNQMKMRRRVMIPMMMRRRSRTMSARFHRFC
jgi:hypothetical protein